jgi:hypothetical protein
MALRLIRIGLVALALVVTAGTLYGNTLLNSGQLVADGNKPNTGGG